MMVYRRIMDRVQVVGGHHQLVDDLTACHIPKDAARVLARGQQFTAIRAECRESNCVGMSLQAVRTLLRIKIPYGHAAIMGRSSQLLFFGSEANMFYACG